MNLNALVSSVVEAVNPATIATYQQSTGSTTAADGGRTPTYGDPSNVTVDVQAMSYKDLIQVQGLNLNGEKRSVYVSGDWRGVARASQQGGDIITMPDNTVWLVVQVLENWFSTAGWAKVAVVLQNNK